MDDVSGSLCLVQRVKGRTFMDGARLFFISCDDRVWDGYVSAGGARIEDKDRLCLEHFN